MAPHSSTLAWKIPWTEEPGSSMGSLRDMTKRLHFHLLLSCIGEGNGNLLQCSCLENPRDGGAWWAAVYGITQSRTRLKGLRSSSSSRGMVYWANPFGQYIAKVFQICPYPVMCVCESLSSVRLFAAPWTVARQTPLSMELSRQEYWSG